MLTSRQRAVATVLCACSLVLLVGAAAYLVAREDPSPPTTTTTTSTSVDADDVATALAAALEEGLEVPLTATEAACVGDAVVRLVPVTQLGSLVDRPEPLTGVAPEVRDELVRAIVGCVPETTAAALLGTATTTTAPLGLPGEQ